MYPPSKKEVDHSRYVNFVAVVFGVDFGSLWWVDDRIWQQKIKTFVEPRAGLGFHPGVSISKKARQSTPETYPMLFGTSSNRGPVRAHNLTPGSKRTAYFGILAPANLDAEDFVTHRGEADKATAHQNNYKPSMNNEEQQSLENFLDQITSAVPARSHG